MQFSKALAFAVLSVSYAAPIGELYQRAETGNALRDGAHGSTTNTAQVMDTLSRQLQSGDGHPTADMISAFITGADSQIDNFAAFLGEALDPVTFGISGAIASVALGPFAQSVTNGAEVLLSNLVGAPADLIAGPALKAFTQNLAKVSAAAKANKIDTSKLDKVTNQLNVRIAAASSKSKRAETGNALRDGAHGSTTNTAQVMDTLSRQLQSGDGHPTADMISAFITGADSQIDNFAAFLGEALDPVTFGISGAIASVALGPFAQSVTNGAEVLLSNLVGAPADLIAGPALKAFTQNLAKVSAAAKANKVDTSKLDKVTAQLNAKIAGASAHAKRAETGNAFRDGAHGSMTNAAQVQDTLSRQLMSGDGHPTADMISAFITGADSQIDNFAAFLGEALDPITFGASGALAAVALGPFAQSLTNGAEVLLSNLVAAPIDMIAGPAMRSYVNNLAKVSAASKANKVDTTKLDKVTAQLNAKIASASAHAKRAETGNALRDGAHGSTTNTAQVMDTLSRQLQSGDGHPTADMISAFITGADSQIDNFAAFLGEALDPVTFGISGAIASVALGPFAQSVTNGAEVLLSNLVGAPADLIAGPALKAFTQNLAKVSAAAKANKVDTSKLDKVTAQLNAKIASAQRA